MCGLPTWSAGSAATNSASLIWHAGEEQALAKARELELLIARVVIIHGKARIEAAASVGMALLVADTTPEDMIGAADHAMYARKQERRG